MGAGGAAVLVAVQLARRLMASTVTSMSDPEGPSPGTALIIDASSGNVDDQTTSERTGSKLFRPRALAQIDVAAELDNQLPLVPRRSWLLLVGAGAIVVAFLAWCAFTPSVEYVEAQGRVLAPPGLVQVASEDLGTVREVLVQPGAIMMPGSPVATLMTEQGKTTARAVGAGTVWQIAVEPGDPITVGQLLATLLPPESRDYATLAVPEPEAVDVRVGMSVVGRDSRPLGSIVTIAAPVPPERAREQSALEIESDSRQNVVLMAVRLGSPMTAGSLIQARVVTSASTVLRRILGS